MARRKLLTNEHWAGLLALPSDERDVVRHCTLSPEDLAALATKRADHNRLGCALLLCAMRHPGRALDVGEVPPAPMVAYVACQIGTHSDVLKFYLARAQTRREQIAELMRYHGFTVFGRADAVRFLSWLTPIAQLNRKPSYLVTMLVEEVRRQRVLLPSPRVLELVIHHARTRGERITHRALAIDLTAAQSVPDALSPMVGGTIDVDHLAAHWDEALRLAVSVGSGHATASGMLQRLSAYPRQNGLAVALREIGRVERTLFTLDWIRDPALRRCANAGLNKGEARNALARAIFFHRLGELRDRSFENQVYRASGLNLLVAAVILWNTRYLQAAFETLGHSVSASPSTLLRHVAPLGWEHISLTGDYIWTDDAQPAPGVLRPLRDKPSLLVA